MFLQWIQPDLLKLGSGQATKCAISVFQQPSSRHRPRHIKLIWFVTNLCNCRNSKVRLLKSSFLASVQTTYLKLDTINQCIIPGIRVPEWRPTRLVDTDINEQHRVKATVGGNIYKELLVMVIFFMLNGALKNTVGGK